MQAPDGPWTMVMDCHRPDGVDAPSSYWVDRGARPECTPGASGMSPIAIGLATESFYVLIRK